ncbi:MAG: hypothetical protein M3R17_06245 [Bacteroidota bacterium]|nr:hypothetical protein [Bacteroidota bacterium]
MKKNFLFLALAFLQAFQGLNAQSDDVKIITIDFQKKEMNTNSIKGIQKGDWYQIQVININTNVYQVTVGGKDSSRQTALTVPTFGDFGIEALTSAINGLNALGGIISIKKEPTGLKNKELELWEMGSEKGKPSPTANELAMNKYIVELNALSAELGKIKIRIDNIKMQQEFYVLTALQMGPHRVLIDTARYDLTYFINEVTSIRKQVSDLSELCDQKLKGYYATIDFTKIADQKLTAKNDTILKTFAALRETIDKAQESINAEKTAALIRPMIEIQNNSASSYISLPYLYHGDDAKVTVDICPYKKDAAVQSFNATIDFPVFKRTYSGISTGFFVTPLVDNAYSVMGTAGVDTSFKLVNENPGNLSFGVNALVNFGRRFGESNCFYHFAFGPGLAISNKISPRLFFAPGLSFGSRHMLNIDLGITMGYVGRLSNAYSLDQKYSSQPQNFMVSRFGYGMFLSVGYVFNL